MGMGWGMGGRTVHLKLVRRFRRGLKAANNVAEARTGFAEQKVLADRT